MAAEAFTRSRPGRQDDMLSLVALERRCGVWHMCTTMTNSSPRDGLLRSLLHCLIALALGAALSACATPIRQKGVPVELTEQATVLGGIPHARYFANTQAAAMAEEGYAALARERAQLGPAAAAGGDEKGAIGVVALAGQWQGASREKSKAKAA
jgi:hypothetical protein